MSSSTQKWSRRAKELDSIIRSIIKSSPNITRKGIAEVIAQTQRGSLEYLARVVGQWFKDNNQETTPLQSQEKEKTKSGLELRDCYVINWSNQTIITDLGQYGNYVASFDRHSLIQRKYVYDHGNETAAIVAMEFDFIHTKAVYLYAKIHGFTKASPPQTDLEFELGKTVEESVTENIQHKKLQVYKQTQKRKWQETEVAASKWWNFENTIVEAIKAINFDQIKVDQLQYIIPQTDYKFAAVIGISDIHYLKLCYDHLGGVVYDREIARSKVKDHTVKLAQETARYGRPDHFYVIVGNDNIHVDGIHHSTTKLTSQHEATDGLWRLELKNYIQLQLDLINYYKQISPVIVVPVKGNHDLQTSVALNSFLQIYYENDPQVQVIVCHDSRVYTQYNKVCLIYTHGDDFKGITRLEGEVHKLILGEAKLQGINLQEVEYFILIHGHEHVGSTRDLNGRVQRIGLSSLSGIDDYWHKGSGYVGRQPESQVIIIDPATGRKGILYA